MKPTFNRSALSVALCACAVIPAYSAENDSIATTVITAKAQNYEYQEAIKASKSNKTIAETPFSVSVITQDFIEDTGVTSLQDSLTYTAGVFAGQFGLDSRADLVQIRGSSSNNYVDGLRTDFGFYNRARTEPYTLDHIEALKGPASALYGQGAMGGIINSESKAPQEDAVSEVWLQGGNNNRKQIAIDTQTDIAGREDLQFRFVGLGRDSDTMVKNVVDDRVVINPSLRWQINDTTDLTVIGLSQRDKGGTSLQFLPQNLTIGKPTSERLPTDTFLAHPDFDKYDTETDSLTFKLNHEFDENWKASSNFRYLKGSSEYNTQYAISETGLAKGLAAQLNAPVALIQPRLDAMLPGDNLLMLSSAEKRKLSSFGWDTQIKGDFVTGKVSHDFVAGLDLSKNTLDLSSWSDRNEIFGLINSASQGNAAALQALQAKQVDPYNPNPNLPTGVNLTKQPSSTLKQQGIYLQDSMSIGSTELSTALRWSKYDNSKSDGTKSISGDKASGRIGALYKFENGFSPYISYATAFTPIAGTDANNKLYKPLENKQVEVGFKYQPAGENYSFNTAFFKSVENNRQTQDATNPLLGKKIQLDEVTIKGAELEFQGNWGRLSTVANYTYTDSEVTKDSTNNYQGNALFGTPKHQASAFAKYAIDKNLSVGAGVRYIGSSDNGLGTVTTPSVKLLDAVASYQIEDWKLSMNVRNLQDKEYVASCSGESYCYYGERRTVLLNARYQF